jgi:hypothetical protein
MTIQTKTYECHQCHKILQSPIELALHIMQNKSHRYGRIWAAKVLAGSTLRTRIEYKRIDPDPDHEPTEYGDENRQNSKVKLSGHEKTVSCFCPKCKQVYYESVPVEFLQLKFLWMSNGKPISLCGNCRR